MKTILESKALNYFYMPREKAKDKCRGIIIALILLPIIAFSSALLFDYVESRSKNIIAENITLELNIGSPYSSEENITEINVGSIIYDKENKVLKFKALGINLEEYNLYNYLGIEFTSELKSLYNVNLITNLGKNELEVELDRDAIDALNINNEIKRLNLFTH